MELGPEDRAPRSVPDLEVALTPDRPCEAGVENGQQIALLQDPLDLGSLARRQRVELYLCPAEEIEA